VHRIGNQAVNPKRGQVAQVVERSPEKAGVGGSTPSLATTFQSTRSKSFDCLPAQVQDRFAQAKRRSQTLIGRRINQQAVVPISTSDMP
jgi:hypothetical protein